MSANDEKAGVTSPYRRFANSHRRMHASENNSFSMKKNQRVHPPYHRNAEVAKQKAISISDQVNKGSLNDTPSPHKYKKPTIFDPEKAEIVRKGYRDAHNDNPNKIINNNTQFRIFNEIRPRDEKVAPLENLNLNPNKWKPRVTYYFRENKGEVQQPQTTKGKNSYEKQFGVKSRDNRINNSKRQLQNYLNLVNTDMRVMN